MSLERLTATWEELGRVDPLWAVLVRPERRHGGWPVDEFFATGVEHVDHVVRQLKASDLDLGDRVLDFGCGVGRLSNALADRARDVTGIDIARSMIDEANRRNRNPGRVRFVHYDGRTLPFEDDSFDCVVSLISIQHSPPAVQLACLVELQRVVRPGGALAVQIPIGPVGASPIAEDAMRADVSVVSAPAELGIGQQVPVQVRITNVSDHLWSPSAQIRVGNHWHRAGRMVWLDDGRANLTRPVAPGEAVDVRLVVTAPVRPGAYELEFDLLQESVTWWADVGSVTARTPVQVVEQPVEIDERGEAIDAPVAARGTNEAQMEVFGMAENLVHLLFTHAGCQVRAAIPDELAGPGWDSRTYIVEVG